MNDAFNRFWQFWAQLKLSFKISIQYRADYLLTVLSLVIAAGVEIALWRLVMKDRGQVASFGIVELLIYLVVANITGTLTVNWSAVMEISEEIRSGRVSRHLLKPMSLYSVATADWLAYKIPMFIGVIPVFVTLGILWPVIFHPSLLEIALYAMGLGTALWLCSEIYFLIILSAFWVSENSGIAIAFNVLRWGFVGSAFPLSFYPKWALDILDATPLPYLVYYPTLVFMGRMAAKAFILKMSFALAMGLALTILRRVLWKMAEHRLQTVGG